MSRLLRPASTFVALACLLTFPGSELLAQMNCPAARPSDQRFSFSAGNAVKVYVPAAAPNGPECSVPNPPCRCLEASNLDAIAQMLQPSLDRWQEQCVPSLQSFEVVRGTRPANDKDSIQVEVRTNESGNPNAEYAGYEPFDNRHFFWNTRPLPHGGGCQSWTPSDTHHRDLVTHEVGHILGLDHDGCGNVNPGGPPVKSIMKKIPEPGDQHGIGHQHCLVVRERNHINACTEDELNAAGDCCFYCGFPRWLDMCQMLNLPIACGNTIPPSGFICFHILETTRVTRTAEVSYSTGTALSIREIEISHSYIDCFPINGPAATSPELEGEGPILFIRSIYDDPMTGVIPVAGVLRDDTYGGGQLSFWLDGQPVAIQGLRTGLYDPYTCSEEPASGCEAFSRWEGALDTSGLADGAHTLTVVGANGRFGEPIPNFAEVTFTVDHGEGCSETTPPTVSLTAPGSGAVVSGMTQVTASASDASGIDRVQFYVDGVRQSVDGAPPWVYSWDTSMVGDGGHTLAARAVDLCGNAAWGANVPVTVANGAPVTVTFAPSDDTWVNQDEPDRAFGVYNYMRVRTHLGNNGRISYLKFHLSGITGPVTSAKLRLRSQDQPIHLFGVYRITSNAWSEDTLTWNTAPLTHDWFSGEQNGWGAETWRDFDVTGAVTGNSTLTFGLSTGQNVGQLDIWSKESNLYVPELEVTFVPGTQAYGSASAGR